jgi:DNA-binding response OmpR family regulator
LSFFRSNVLLCDDENGATAVLTSDLRGLGHAVTVARSCADTFAAACTYDFDALVVAPFLRDGSALVLPGALGIRRPRLVILTCRLGEHLMPSVARRVGFDMQLTKVVDARKLDRLLRASITEAAAEVLGVASPAGEAQAPTSEVGARGPR